jgi:16S rRNA processing protein RimM
MPADRVVLGVILRPHGVRGLVRIASYTEPAAAIASYGPLADEHGRRFALCWRGEGIVELAEIVGGSMVKVADRTSAAQLANRPLYVARERLPAPAADEFYLSDLVGLAAFDRSGREIGEVVAVHDYGAGTSVEIARAQAAPLLVPFTRTAVPEVDIEQGRMTVSPPLVIEARPDAEVAA